MAKKKHAPIAQLREAAKVANDMLVERGIRHKKSFIDQITHDSRAPVLPGIPAYLPHEWTLSAVDRMMRDIVIMWKKETDHAAHIQDDITEFWKFALRQFDEMESAFNKQMVKAPELVKKTEEKVGKVPLLKDVFSPMRNKENVKAIRRFMIDTFAVAITLKQHHSVGEFLNWYISWTQELRTLWHPPKEHYDTTQ